MLKSITLALLAGASVSGLGVRYDKEWKATLAPRNGSQLSGSVEIEAIGSDSTKMEVKVTGGEKRTDYAWHMHSGACAANGPVVGPPAAYPQLSTDTTGSAKLEVRLAIAAPGSGEHSVHVHAPSSDTASTGATVACGDLKQEAPN